jgi:hypothetical protein
MYKKFFTGILFSALALFVTLPHTAHAQGVSGMIVNILDILNRIVPIIVGLAALVFIASLVQYAGSVGDPKKRTEANGRMVFGIVVIAVMLGVWGLVNIVVSVFDINPYAPPAIEVPTDIGGELTGDPGSLGSDPGGLVPCGRSGQDPCTACDLYQLAHNVMNYIMFLSVPLAVLSIAIGGVYILLAAGGNSGLMGKGRDIITTALLGLIIILVSWLVINTIISQLANPGVLQLPWNQVIC